MWLSMAWQKTLPILDRTDCPLSLLCNGCIDRQKFFLNIVIGWENTMLSQTVPVTWSISIIVQGRSWFSRLITIKKIHFHHYPWVGWMEIRRLLYFPQQKAIDFVATFVWTLFWPYKHEFLILICCLLFPFSIIDFLSFSNSDSIVLLLGVRCGFT